VFEGNMIAQSFTPTVIPGIGPALAYCTTAPGNGKQLNICTHLKL